jgi:hypothetical protein
MEILVIWLLAIVVGAIMGHRKGQLVSGIVWPVLFNWLGVIIVAFLKPLNKKCPRCAEAIKQDAQVCKHCGHSLTDPAVATPSMAPAVASAAPATFRPALRFEIHRNDGQPQTPLTRPGIATFLRQGILKPTDYYLDPDINDWRPLADFPETTVAEES